MAAQGGIRDKILRVSMPFEKGTNSEEKARAMPSRKRLLFGDLEDPWQVVLKVHSWAKQLGEGRVHTCTEVARMEGITRARVSQLWPLSRITREQAEPALRERSGRAVSLRTLIKFARKAGVK
jgi:alkylated DNA nucleotide flippase Atl1